MKNKPTIYDVNAEQEEKDYTHPIEKEVYELLMLNMVNIIVDRLRTFEGFPPEFRNIAADHYRIYAVRLLRQYIDKRDFENDFIDVLKAFEPKFKEVVIEWHKRRIARIHLKINDNPTDELYDQIIHDQVKAENEFINNPSLYLLPMYSERLTSLMDKLKERRAIVGSFDTQFKTVNISQPKVEIPALKGNSELKEKAQGYLVALSGNWLNGEKIMTDEEYTKVVRGVFHLIDTGKVKAIDKKIDTSAPMQFIRRLFREVNTELYGKGIKDCIIDFLHAYFECFSLSEPSTTKNNFKEYRNGDFDSDYNLTMKSIRK